MEVTNNAAIDSSLLVGEGQKNLGSTLKQNGANQSEEATHFKDAARVDITDPNFQKSQTRELAQETEQFLVNSGIDMEDESVSFDKQSILAVAGSYTAAQGHASAVATRALLS